MNAADKRIAATVEHEARLRLYDRMTVEQRHALRRWLERAAAYRERFPDSSFDEVRAAVRALRDVPMSPYAQMHARVTEQQANAELERICGEVRRRHQEKHQ